VSNFDRQFEKKRSANNSYLFNKKGDLQKQNSSSFKKRHTLKRSSFARNKPSKKEISSQKKRKKTDKNRCLFLT